MNEVYKSHFSGLWRPGIETVIRVSNDYPTKASMPIKLLRRIYQGNVELLELCYLSSNRFSLLIPDL